MFEDEEFDERFISSSMIDEDEAVENVLRPKTMQEYIGQKQVKDNLMVYIKAAFKSCLCSSY